MHARLAARAALAVALALCAVPSAAHARGAPKKTFRHERFTLSLPPGWWVADWRPGPPARRFAPAKRPRAAASASVVHFANARGDFFSVYVDHANDFEGDAVWTLRATREGDSVEVGAEAPCERGRGPCSAGNGTLEIGTLPAVELHGHRFSFQFGNTRREQGVALDPFRWMLQEFRARAAAP
jgi:hypothetical protein